jgi:hypothetical protein
MLPINIFAVRGEMPEELVEDDGEGWATPAAVAAAEAGQCGDGGGTGVVDSG